jgi:hypothetical protein
MTKPKTKTENIVVQEMENEVLIYDLQTSKAFCLNETSAIIYQLCDGKNSIEQINRSLSQKLQQPIDDKLIWLALDSFKKENLLEQSKEFTVDFNGLSRRQVIKKIGLSSLLALPVIVSVVTPAAGAQASICYAADIGVCMMAAAEICPASCAPGTPIMITLYSSLDPTCSGGAVGSGTGGCPSGPIGFPYIIN